MILRTRLKTLWVLFITLNWLCITVISMAALLAMSEVQVVNTALAFSLEEALIRSSCRIAHPPNVSKSWRITNVRTQSGRKYARFRTREPVVTVDAPRDVRSTSCQHRTCFFAGESADRIELLNSSPTKRVKELAHYDRSNAVR